MYLTHPIATFKKIQMLNYFCLLCQIKPSSVPYRMAGIVMKTALLGVTQLFPFSLNIICSKCFIEYCILNVRMTCILFVYILIDEHISIPHLYYIFSCASYIPGPDLPLKG